MLSRFRQRRRARLPIKPASGGVTWTKPTAPPPAGTRPTGSPFEAPAICGGYPCCGRTPCVDRDVVRARHLPAPGSLPRMPDSVVNYENGGDAATQTVSPSDNPMPPEPPERVIAVPLRR